MSRHLGLNVSLRAALAGFMTWMLALSWSSSGAEPSGWERAVAADRDRADELFRAAVANGDQAREALLRCHRYLHAWLRHTDPITGLIPRNLKEGGDYWNGRDAGADNYPFMVLSAALTEPSLVRGRLRDMLRTEQRLTARVDRLVDDYSFSKRGWRRDTLDLDATLFDSAEYVKDGLIPLTEWLGSSPWSQRMIGLMEDIWKHARVETPFGPVPTSNFEVHGDLLQAGARLFWLTGEAKYLDWSIRLGDYYLSGSHHPTRHRTELRLRDHGCEVINGLTELYVALTYARPDKAATYRQPLHELFDTILRLGRNEHGMLYDTFNPQTGAHSATLCDTWGYDYDGFYTLYLVDGVQGYRDATRLALGHLRDHYTGYPWEGTSADGYADAIEGALNLHNREPHDAVAAWIDSEIRVMWSKQQPDGIIEGWHGDGNFARTSVMYALWKTQGIRMEPWRADLRAGAVMHHGVLYVSIQSDQPWKGRAVFDRPRHRDILHLPLDYPRINQFPEWFVTGSDLTYVIQVEGNSRPSRVKGRVLQQGWPVKLEPRTPLCWRISWAG